MIQKLFASTRHFFSTRLLLLAMIIGITVAIIMTIISMTIYNYSDVSRLDISRPGYESLRKSVVKDETTTFDSSGTLNSRDVEDFQKLYDKKRQALNALGKFDGDALNDDQLKIVPSE